MVSKQKTVLITVVTAVVVCVLSIFGTLIINEYAAAASGNRNILSNTDYAAWLKYEELEAVNRTIHERYYGEIDNQKLMTNAAKGMVYGLEDPYSAYFTPEEYKRLNEETEGIYGGVGLLVTVDPEDRLVTVVQVYKNTPAEAAGVRIRDKIVAVNGEDVRGWEMENVTVLLRGQAGTQVSMQVLRGEELVDFELERAEITVDRAESRMMGDIGYIKMYEFNGNGQDLVLKAIKDMKKQGAKGIIFDLRDNPGGLLNQAVAVADELVPQGPVVNFKDNKGRKSRETSNAYYMGLPLVVLINENSASASELVAGCIKDYQTGTLVGVNTFGKGIVQSIFPINGESALKITTSQFFTPLEHTIHKVGIAPDVEVEMPEELKKNPSLITEENDVQLQKGLEILRGKINGQ